MKKSKKQEEGLAWQILTEDEQSALMLSINFGKSTWEAGELMNKAHYKYLEIQARANKFFRMFHEYFQATGDLRIPKDCLLNNDFRDYIIYTVFERKSKKEALDKMKHTAFFVSSAKERILAEGLERLGNSENELEQMLYDVIIEFDRWNNNRILPISLQEPSAFKRRNKTRLIKHLNNLSKLDPFHIHRFTNRFKAKKSEFKVYYITLLSSSYESGYEIIRVKKKKELFKYISKHLRLYIFDEHVDADQFGFLITRYLMNHKKDCKVGQQFWPKYRKAIECASNYLEVNNIIPRRKNLEKAFRDLDNLKLRKKEKNQIKQLTDPQKRADSAALWNI